MKAGPFRHLDPSWAGSRQGSRASLVVTCSRGGEGRQKAEEGQPGAGGGSPGSRSCPGEGTKTGWMHVPRVVLDSML